MKRCVMSVLCLVILASGAFAMDKAAGGGLLFNAGWTSGEDSWNNGWTLSRTGFGVFGFFGLGRFLELNLGFLYKDPNEIKITSEGQTSTYKRRDINLEGTAALQLGVYGKYPFPLSDMFVFFPTAGIDFEISLSSETWGDWEWWHDIWIRAGAGLDVFFTERMFLRTHLIYGVAVPVGGASSLGMEVGHGLLLKVGLGWMF